MSTQAQRAKAQPTTPAPFLPEYPREVIEGIQRLKEETKPEATGATNNLHPVCQPGTASPAARSHMQISRSLSSDGQLNSITVVIDYPIRNESVSEIKAKAQEVLQLQSEIIRDHFEIEELKAILNQSVASSNDEATGEGEPAILLDIGSMPVKWGTRYFINAEVGGQPARLYGTPMQLVTHLARIGHDLTPDAISAGLKLNFACRAVAQLNAKGDALNIVRLFPAAQSPGIPA